MPLFYFILAQNGFKEPASCSNLQLNYTYMLVPNCMKVLRILLGT